MASVNATRRGQAEKVTDALEHAKLVGYDESGHVCVWYGGYGFNVYDTLTWDEVNYFSSGDLAGVSRNETPERCERIARERMRSEGFTPV